jgi:SAM-dependent methyltransferase
VMNQSDYWNALAPYLPLIENNFLDPRSINRVLHKLRQPILIIGAGQGLLVEHLIRKGFQTDGVDLSPEMIQYAKQRRGLSLIEADARALPFEAGSYETVIFATGVVDFLDDEELIRSLLDEAKRVQNPTGNTFVAFYKISAASEQFSSRLGLLRGNVLQCRETMELYRLKTLPNLRWIAKKANVGLMQALALALHCWIFLTFKEKVVAFNTQRIYRGRDRTDVLVTANPETLPFRREAELRNLFGRLGTSIRSLETLGSCYVAEI